MHTQPKMTIYETAINASKIARQKYIKKCAGRFKKKGLQVCEESAPTGKESVLEYMAQEIIQMIQKPKNDCFDQHQRNLGGNTTENDLHFFGAQIKCEEKNIQIETKTENKLSDVSKIRKLDVVREEEQNQKDGNFYSLEENDNQEQLIEIQVFGHQNSAPILEREEKEGKENKGSEKEEENNLFAFNFLKKTKKEALEEQQYIPLTRKETCSKTKPQKFSKNNFLVEYRENQFNEIKKYIKKQLKSEIDSKGQPLIVYGSPGNGKTTCIHAVLADLNLKELVFQIKVISNRNWYKTILNGYGIRCNLSNAILLFGLVAGTRISKQLRKKIQKMHNTPKIIIFDEFDTAFTQQDLYNIYELSKNTRACIILVGNKSDYMSQMQSKIHSRYSQNPLFFVPYSIDCVEKIMIKLFPQVDRELIHYSILKKKDNMDIRTHIDSIEQLRKNKKKPANRQQLFQLINTTIPLTTQQMVEILCKDLMSLFILKSTKREEVTHLRQLFQFTGYNIPRRYIMYTLQNLIDTGLVTSSSEVVPSRYGKIWIYASDTLLKIDLPQFNILDLLNQYEQSEEFFKRNRMRYDLI